MKRLILLAAVLVLLAACGGAATEPDTVATKPAEATTAAESEPAPTEPAVEESTEAEAPAPTVDPNDPLQVRERDWKLNEVEDPAVAIIEYGDFQ
jgi:ABC-type glycerol-3-phosphate transport system substrate-binding protein